jgi:hypothetical protein
VATGGFTPQSLVHCMEDQWSKAMVFRRFSSIHQFLWVCSVVGALVGGNG